MKRIYFTRFPSQLGDIVIAGNSKGLLQIAIEGTPEKTWIHDPGRFKTYRKAIQQYFQGNLQTLSSLPLNLQGRGTSFQRKVWKKIKDIPVGKTRTYGEIAADLGNPHASRAVGGACNANPLPLLVPCHRVVGKGGALRGFACGLEKKRFLLNLEKAGDCVQ